MREYATRTKVAMLGCQFQEPLIEGGGTRHASFRRLFVCGFAAIRSTATTLCRNTRDPGWNLRTRNRHPRSRPTQRRRATYRSSATSYRICAADHRAPYRRAPNITWRRHATDANAAHLTLGTICSTSCFFAFSVAAILVFGLFPRRERFPRPVFALLIPSRWHLGRIELVSGT